MLQCSDSICLLSNPSTLEAARFRRSLLVVDAGRFIKNIHDSKPLLSQEVNYSDEWREHENYTFVMFSELSRFG